MVRALEIDDRAKEIVQELGTALEIGLRPNGSDEESSAEETSLSLTDEDLQILQRMKIRIDPE